MTEKNRVSNDEREILAYIYQDTENPLFVVDDVRTANTDMYCQIAIALESCGTFDFVFFVLALFLYTTRTKQQQQQQQPPLIQYDGLFWRVQCFEAKAA